MTPTNPPKTNKRKTRAEETNKDGQAKKDRAKVTKDVFLTKVIKVTSLLNLKKRKLNEKTWNMDPISQYRKRRKTVQEKYQMKSRATQGWMPKETVEEIKIGANMHLNRKRRKGKKTLKVPRTTILAACSNIVRDILNTNKKLYIRCMKHINERRKEEGVSLAAISNKKLDYRAEMLNRKSIKKDKKGNRPRISIGGHQDGHTSQHNRDCSTKNNNEKGGSPRRGSRSPEKGSPSPEGDGHGTGIT
jgi:hypothetical protein